VFQGSLLPALGISITPWQPTSEVLVGIGVTYLAGCWMMLLARRGDLRVWHLAVNGLIYVIYVSVMLT
jgi:cation:H+ antiporter